MNGRFLRGKEKRWVFSLLLFLPWLILLVIRGVAPPWLSYVLGFLAIMTTFVSLAFLFTPASVGTASCSLPASVSAPAQQVTSRRRSPFPLTAFEVHRQMSDVDFEYLAAAVVMVLEGYQFERRCGGRGDQGVDAVLINHYGMRVVIQAKCYALHRSIGSDKLREFGEGMRMYNAVKGYFVTTSTFTTSAMQVVRSNGFISPINGRRLEAYLQQHADQIGETYHAIRSSAP